MKLDGYDRVRWHIYLSRKKNNPESFEGVGRWECKPAAWQLPPLLRQTELDSAEVWFRADILPRRVLLLLMIMGRRALIGLSDVTDVLFPSCRSPLGCNSCLHLLVPPSFTSSQRGCALKCQPMAGRRLPPPARRHGQAHTYSGFVAAKRLLIKNPISVLCFFFFFCLWFPQSLSQTGGFQEPRMIGCGRKPLAAGDESRGCTSLCEL